jgi:hypothetical protein
VPDESRVLHVRGNHLGAEGHLRILLISMLFWVYLKLGNFGVFLTALSVSPMFERASYVEFHALASP